jgi:hypothetical protein
MTNKENKMCTKCKGEMRRAYIRKMTQWKSKWIPIGYYCQDCGDIILEPIQIQKNDFDEKTTKEKEMKESKSDDIIDILIADPDLLDVVTILYDGGNYLSDILEDHPELAERIDTEEKKSSIIEKIKKYNIGYTTEPDDFITLNENVIEIIDHMKKM